jgi:hypothetical protein
MLALNKIQLQQLAESYTFRDDEQVREVLEQNTFLVPLLVDTYRSILDYFAGSQVFIEAVTDYENFVPGLEASDDLVISIATALPPKEAFKKLDTFYDNWWSRVFRQAKGKISIGLEFIR